MAKVISITCIVFSVFAFSALAYEFFNDNLIGQKNYIVPTNETTGTSLVVEEFLTEKFPEYIIEKSEEVIFIKMDEYNQLLDVYSKENKETYRFNFVFNAKKVFDVKAEGE